MAASGFTPIQLYYSTSAATAPTAGNLLFGELALNITDGKLYYKDNLGVVQTIASTAGNVNVSSISFGSTGLTPSTATTGAVTVGGTLNIASGGTNGSASPTAGAIAYGTGTAYGFNSAGTLGQILVSGGAGAPTWSNLSSVGVTTFSGGTTGLTPAVATSGAITLGGTLAVANGGTGVTTSTGTGSVVLSNSPTLTTPNLGTPSALVGTNITGTASGLSIGGTAARATDVAGGVANQVLYQIGVNDTGFIAAPTTSNTYLQWNGSAFAWAAAGGATTLNALTINSSGAGAASPTTFDGSVARTISYNTVGAPSITGTNASGTWNISVTGNAGTVTNGVYTTGSYADPSWITSLAGSKITGTVPSATNATTFTNTGAVSTNASFFINFLAANTSTNQGSNTSANLSFNPSTGLLSTTGISYSGTLTGGTGIVNIGSGQFYKAAGGNISIGSTSSVAKLYVRGGNSDNLTIDNAGEQFTTMSWYNNGAGRAQQYWDQTNGVFVSGTDVAGAYLFKTNTIERMRISSTGNVSIGSASTPISLFISATDALGIPVGDNSQRPTGATGYIRYNTDISQFEGYNGTAWSQLGGGATGGGGDQVFVENSTIVTTSYTLPAGKNAMSVGPISLNAGVSVTVPGGQRWVVL